MIRSGPPLDPSLFSPANSHFAAAALHNVSGPHHGQSLSQGSMVSPLRDHFGHSHSNSAGNMDNLFADFTTEDGRNEAGEALEERGMDMSMEDGEETARSLADEFLNQ